MKEIKFECWVTGKEEIWARDGGMDTTFWVLKLGGADDRGRSVSIHIKMSKEETMEFTAGNTIVFSAGEKIEKKGWFK